MHAVNMEVITSDHHVAFQDMCAGLPDVNKTMGKLSCDSNHLEMISQLW